MGGGPGEGWRVSSHSPCCVHRLRCVEVIEPFFVATQRPLSGGGEKGRVVVAAEGGGVWGYGMGWGGEGGGGFTGSKQVSAYCVSGKSIGGEAWTLLHLSVCVCVMCFICNGGGGAEIKSVTRGVVVVAFLFVFFLQTNNRDDGSGRGWGGGSGSGGRSTREERGRERERERERERLTKRDWWREKGGGVGEGRVRMCF